MGRDEVAAGLLITIRVKFVRNYVFCLFALIVNSGKYKRDCYYIFVLNVSGTTAISKNNVQQRSYKKLKGER